MMSSCCSHPVMDAASCHQELTFLIKRTLSVSRSTSTMSVFWKGTGTTNIRGCRRPMGTSAASVHLPAPAPCATAPVPRQDSHANVAILDYATIAPTQCSPQLGNPRQDSRMTSIVAARFRQCAGQPLDPLIPIYNISSPHAVDNNETDFMGIKINNTSGDAEDYNNDKAIYFNVLMVLPAFSILDELNKDGKKLPHCPLLFAPWPMWAMWNQC